MNNKGLHKRLHHSFNTRYSGYEDISSQLFYMSMLAAGEPVEWIDRLSFRVPLNMLNLNLDWESFFIPMADKHNYQFGIKIQYQIEGVIIKTGQTSEGIHLYIEMLCISPYRSVLSAFIDVIRHLQDIDLILSKSRRSARRCVKKFTMIEVECRYDFAAPLSDVLQESIEPYIVSGVAETDKYSVNLSSYENRHKQGSLFKCYERVSDNFKFLRLEIVLYRKLLTQLNVDLSKSINRRPGKLLSSLWEPQKQAIIQMGRNKKGFSKLLLTIIHRPQPLDKRAKFLKLSKDLVTEMTNQAQLQNIF